ncbi:MAG: helix-turn-helix transcriptional regulator [Tepidisphaerales bacterium]
MTLQMLKLEGRDYVVVPKADWDRIAGITRGLVDSDELPPLPAPDADGSVDAIAYARASIARGIIQDRRRLRLTQQDLAHLAGVRQETISRIETCKVSPTRRIVEKLDAAIKKAKKKRTG